MSLAFFRDAPWLTRSRIRDYAIMLIVAYVVMILWLWIGHGTSDPLGRPIGTDFVSFWTVSWALHNSQVDTVYAPESLAALERAVVAGDSRVYAWLYPPIALFIVYPLAFLPYLWSLIAWLSLGLAGYLMALWRILPRGLTLVAGIAFPAVLVTIEHGQNAFLTTILFTSALLLLVPQPVAAGILIGFLLFKPQLGLLIPFALIAGGYWRAFIAAAATAIGLTIATLVCFGAQIWSAYGAVIPLARDVLDLGLVPHFKMQSIHSAVQLLGGSAALGDNLQIVAAIGGVVFVAWVWRQTLDQSIKSAALIVASLFATPFLLDYDLLLLAPAVAWMASLGLRRGFLPWERLVLAAVSIDPLVARVIAQHADLPATPIVMLAFIVLIGRRTLWHRRRIQPEQVLAAGDNATAVASIQS